MTTEIMTIIMIITQICDPRDVIKSVHLKMILFYARKTQKRNISLGS